MFGTMGFSELIIILAIVLIIFGAGRLPQIGEGIGKALKGFKKEVHEAPPPVDPQAESTSANAHSPSPPVEEAKVARPQAPPPETARPAAPYQPGPELTPGTTAALMATGAGPQAVQSPRPRSAQPAPAQTSVPHQAEDSPAQPASHSAPPPTMEQRMAQPPRPVQGTYPPLPASAQGKPVAKRPSAVVNKEAVARVQAQQAAMKGKNARAPQAPSGQNSGLSPQDMQGLGESLGDALRTFRQAAADVRGSIDPEMRTMRAEMDAAQKEIEQSVEAAKQMPAVQEDPPEST
jgi:TatA/E family protein of Tat protein translocase